MKKIALVAPLLVVLALSPVAVAAPALDERPAEVGEWGYRPADGAVSRTDPPAFSWRPQRGLTYEIQCSRDGSFEDIGYATAGVEMSVHCPARVLGAGRWFWRYRGSDRGGGKTRWSRVRSFAIAPDSTEFPLPARAEILARIPKTHPRLFLRPENLPALRERAKGDLKAQADALRVQCEKLLARPPDVSEPPTYPRGTVRGSDPWRAIWWGNRKRTIAALEGSATLAFGHLLFDRADMGAEAKRILMACADWSPVGSTGYRYNDEAGMPYAYHFSRTYTFLADLLTEEERKRCRRVMKVRGDEMYRHLFPRHLWRPYSSHSNRAWHFLGEVGIAFLGEVEGAEDWVWFAMNVFRNVYPVWSDDDGGWHEGINYWSSYVGRFTWWADVMREATGVDAFQLPYFSRAGDFAMWLMPPGKRGGGFGDLNARVSSGRLLPLLDVLAAQAGHRHWRWWVDSQGGSKPYPGYVSFLRGALPAVEPKPPTDVPASRLFRGTGVAALNSTLLDANECVQILVKSSPFGTQSHGYEANNAFLLWAYGQRLLVRSGYRDSYGSDHHTRWMWSPRSVNTITVDGRAQPPHQASSTGRISAFETTPPLDLVVGRAGSHKRAIIFAKPDTFVVADWVWTKEPAQIDQRLHALNRFELGDEQRAALKVGDVGLHVDFVEPKGLEFSQTNEYSPNPRPRIKLREWHLTALAPGNRTEVRFVTVYRVFRGEPKARPAPVLTVNGAASKLVVTTADGDLTVLLPATRRAKVMTSRGEVSLTE